MNLSTLPEPNQHGGYWFGVPGGTDVPAILPIRSVPGQQGKYMLLRGQSGALFAGSQFRAFDTPEDALRELRIHLGYSKLARAIGKGSNR